MSIYWKYPKDPDEEIVLTVDFSQELETGETLSGTPTVTITSPDDATPAITNGSASISGDGVLVPVKDGLNGATYFIKAVCETSTTGKKLSITGGLRVRKGS